VAQATNTDGTFRKNSLLADVNATHQLLQIAFGFYPWVKTCQTSGMAKYSVHKWRGNRIKFC